MACLHPFLNGGCLALQYSTLYSVAPTSYTVFGFVFLSVPPKEACTLYFRSRVWPTMNKASACSSKARGFFFCKY